MLGVALALSGPTLYLQSQCFVLVRKFRHHFVERSLRRPRGEKIAEYIGEVCRTAQNMSNTKRHVRLVKIRLTDIIPFPLELVAIPARLALLVENLAKLGVHLLAGVYGIATCDP